LTATTPPRTPSSRDVEVLAGLRHDALVGRHHEQGAVDAAGAAIIVWTSRSWRARR